MSGYSGKPLWQKLGIKENFNLVLKNTTQYATPAYLDFIQFTITKEKTYTHLTDMVHIFVDSKSTLTSEIEKIIAVLKKDGVIWVSWPKKSSKINTDLSEDIIRDVILPIGLVDVKVCSVSEELWSGLKIVIRKENR